MRDNDIQPGDMVAFNSLDDAVWFYVLVKNGHSLIVREVDTDYQPQSADTSMVKQHIKRTIPYA